VRERSRGITLLEMLVVVALIALIAGLSYPSVGRGLDTIRLRGGADDLAAFLASAMASVERTESPMELRFSFDDATVVAAGPLVAARTLRLPDGVRIEALYRRRNEPGETERSVMLMPGGGLPRLTLELVARNGVRRWVTVDAVTGVPLVEEQAPAPDEEAEQ
jgi:general secretion pathway protein H